MVKDIIIKWWFELQNKYKNIILDEYAIMPDHFHGIIMIVNNDAYNPAPPLHYKPYPRGHPHLFNNKSSIIKIASSTFCSSISAPSFENVSL